MFRRASARRSAKIVFAALAIVTALKQHSGNVSAAARALNVSRNTIYRRLRTDKTTPEMPSHEH